MRKHRVIAVAAAAAISGGLLAVVAAEPSWLPTPLQHVIDNDHPGAGPDTPGQPDLPEPGDTPD